MNKKIYTGSSTFIVADGWKLAGVIDKSSITTDSDGDRIIKAGTVVAKNTAGKLIPYVKDGSDGAGTPVGIIVHNVDVTVKDDFSNYLVQGMVDKTKLTGYDSSVESVLKFIMFI